MNTSSSTEFRWWKRSALVFGTLFGILLLTLLLQKPQQTTPHQILTSQPLVTPDDDPSLGDEEAPVTIIEFADFQCPSCKQFHDDTFSFLLERYIATGKVRFIYRDLPLTENHAWSFKAAEAAECADEQAKFWEFHELIFTNQHALTSLQQPVSTATSTTTTITQNNKNILVNIAPIIASLKQLAAELGLDTTQFNACLDTSKQRSEVEKDRADAASAGIIATPTLFINGKKVEGALPKETLQHLIERELFI